MEFFGNMREWKWLDQYQGVGDSGARRRASLGKNKEACKNSKIQLRFGIGKNSVIERDWCGRLGEIFGSCQWRRRKPALPRLAKSLS